MTEFEIRSRSFFFRGIVLLAFAVLATQLWKLQVVQRDVYTELADANRFRLSQVLASRGVIYDRNGELLVRNRPAYDVTIVPAYLPDGATNEAKVLARLSELLNLPITTQIEHMAGYNDGYFHAIMHHQYNRQLSQQIINPRSRQYKNAPLGIRDAVNQNRYYAPFLPVTIAKDVDPIIVSKLEEERLDLPGVIIDIKPSRDYTYGKLLGPILGYTGPIPSEQFDSYKALGYGLTDIVGLAGLEIKYEAWLHGIKGLESVEVNANGQKVRTIDQLIKIQPGHNLRLTIDVKLQEVATQVLQEMLDQEESKQGVAIAMNPQNGEILAMVSLPSFDNNIFSRGVTPRELSLLSEDTWTPLINHAIGGVYPPGSTFKIIPATGALQEKTVTPEMTFLDEGILYLPNQFFPDNKKMAQPFFCWLRKGHGEVDLIHALAYSCNVYFYQIGGGYPPNEYEGLGWKRIGNYARMFGLGKTTGIDLPGEADGLVPDPTWKRLNFAEQWLTGDTYNMSVGQGFVLATPLQMINAYAAIANGGTLYRPYLVKEILDEQSKVVKVNQPEVIGHLEVEPKFLQLVQQGLRMVIEDEAGTARKKFDVPGVVASGKTGTAEFCDDYPQCIGYDGRVQTEHGWFLSYAPSYNPKIVTAVFVYGGGEGVDTAVPVNNKILRYYFGIKDEEQSLPKSKSKKAITSTLPLSETLFTAEFLGTDSWPQTGASVSGFVLNEKGAGIKGVSVDMVANGQVVAQVLSNEKGRFDYIELDDQIARSWEFRLSNYPTKPKLQLEIANGLHYLVEFQATVAY